MVSIEHRRPEHPRSGWTFVYSPPIGESHQRSSRLAPCSFGSRLPSPAMAGELRGCLFVSLCEGREDGKVVDCNQRPG
jgi:hypothetical protein